MNPSGPEINIYKDPDDVAEAAAFLIQVMADQAVRLNQNLFVAISGGGTPVLFFQNLASGLYQESIPWRNIHFFWGDERCVPPDHPESNYGMTKTHLLDHIVIPDENIHRIFGEDDPEGEARRYTDQITQVVPQNARNLPQFDWILLGLGTDGHTASLFPGSPLLTEKNAICSVAFHPETGQKRISLMLPMINNAKRNSFLVTGSKKALVVAGILGKARSAGKYPAALVRPESGLLEWYIDEAAAQFIEKQSCR